MGKAQAGDGVNDPTRAVAIMLDRDRRSVFHWRWVALIVIDNLRLRAQMRDMTTENLLLWKALREAKGVTQ